MAKISNSLRGMSPRRGGGGWFSWKVFLYVFVCVLVCGAVVTWRASLASMVWSVFAPFEQARTQFSSSETAQLRAELASTTARIADRDVLYKENLELKSRLGRDARLTTILAGVLLRPPGTPYDTLIVDAGSAEGVVQGDLVSAGGTTLIGSVREVYTHTSRVVLFSAPGETYDVLLRVPADAGTEAPLGAVPVQMRGQGSGSLVGQVPAGTPVRVGATLVFPGMASGFSGVVSHVDAKEGESFETLYAQLPVNPLSLQYIEIQKNHAQE